MSEMVRGISTKFSTRFGELITDVILYHAKRALLFPVKFDMSRTQGRNNRVGKVQGAPSQGLPGVRQKYRPNYFLVIAIISTVPKNLQVSTRALMPSTLGRGLCGLGPL